jgi:hypothetical protein
MTMHRIKIFKELEYDYEKMERDVNDWLARSGAKVISMNGNIAPQTEAAGRGMTPRAGATGGSSPSDIVLFILYEAP